MFKLNKYFYCYSYPLKEFLRKSGEESVVSGIHPKTNKKYWVFERNNSNNLDKLLDEWKLKKVKGE